MKNFILSVKYCKSYLIYIGELDSSSILLNRMDDLNTFCFLSKSIFFKRLYNLIRKPISSVKWKPNQRFEDNLNQMQGMKNVLLADAVDSKNINIIFLFIYILQKFLHCTIPKKDLHR